MIAVYLNPILGDDANNGYTKDAPVRTWLTALSRAADGSTIYIIGSPYAIASDTVIDGGATGLTDITVAQYSGYFGNLFTATSGTMLTLTNITLRNAVGTASALIGVAAGGRLVIDADVALDQGGSIALDVAALPIEITAPLSAAVYYTLAPHYSGTPGRTLVHLNGNATNANFSIDPKLSGELMLTQVNDDIILQTVPAEGDGIYLSGAGSDGQDGTTPLRAVATWPRAVDLINADPNRTRIYISSAYSPKNGEVWRDGIPVERAPGYDGVLIDIKPIAGVNTTFTIENAEVDNGISGTTAIAAQQNQSLIMTGGSLSAINANAIDLIGTNHTLTLSGGRISSGDTAVNFSNIAFAGDRMLLDGMNAIVNGWIYLGYGGGSNPTIVRVTSPQVTNNYTLYPNVAIGVPFTTGETVVTSTIGVNLGPYLGHFTLAPELTGFALFGTGNDITLSDTQSVYVDPINGDDAASGVSPPSAVKTISAALNRAGTRSATSIYIVGSPLPITTDQSIDIPVSFHRYNYTGQAINILSGTLILNAGVSISGDGRGSDVLVNIPGSAGKRGVLVMNAGSSIHDNANRGITAGSYGDLLMNLGSMIYGNHYNSAQQGVGVHVTGGTFTLNGGEVSGNYCGSGTKGDQVDIVTGVMTFLSGTVASSAPNAIYVQGASTSTGYITLYAAANIQGAIYCDKTNVASNVAPIRLGETLPADTLYLLNLSTAMVGKVIVQGSVAATARPANFALAVDAPYYTLIQGTGANQYSLIVTSSAIYLDGVSGNDTRDGSTPATSVRTFARAAALIAGILKPVILVIGMVTVADTQVWDLSAQPDAVMLRATGFTGVMAYVTGNLTIQDTDISGNMRQVASAQSITEVAASGVLTLNAGAVLRDNKNAHGIDVSGFGSVSAVKVYGRCNIAGGSLLNCTGAYYGSLLLCDANAVCVMSGGVIAGSINTHTYFGCAVTVALGDFTLTDGTIELNSGTDSGGAIPVHKIAVGALSVNTGGSASVTGGQIVRNTGAGAYVYGGTLTMSGGSVSNNAGRGMAIVNDVTVRTSAVDITGGDIAQNLSGGIITSGDLRIRGTANISANTSSQTGGGLLITDGIARINDTAQIMRNTAQSSGGAIALYGAATLLIDGGSIADNAANNAGGGIYVDNGNMTISGGTIGPNNDAANNGGGIYQNAGIISLQGGVIAANTAHNAGGGAYIAGGVFVMSDGGINNNAALGGPGIYLQNGAFTLSGGIIDANTSSLLNTPVPTSGQAHMSGGVFNIATGNGVVNGNIYLANANAITISGALTNVNNIYAILSQVTAVGTVVVKPNGTSVHDATQYFNHFILANTDTTNVIVAAGINLVLGRVYFIDGTSAVKGNGSTPAFGGTAGGPFNSLNDIKDLILEPDTVIFISGRITVDDMQALTTIAPGVSMIRYTGFDVNGVPYTPYLGDLFDVSDLGALALSGFTISGLRDGADEEERALNITGSIIKNAGDVALKDMQLVDNASINPGGGVYQAGELSISGTIRIDNSVFLAAPDHFIRSLDLRPNILRPIIVEIENPYLWYIIVKYPANVRGGQLRNYAVVRIDWPLIWQVMIDGFPAVGHINDPHNIVIGAFFAPASGGETHRRKRLRRPLPCPTMPNSGLCICVKWHCPPLNHLCVKLAPHGLFIILTPSNSWSQSISDVALNAALRAKVTCPPDYTAVLSQSNLSRRIIIDMYRR